MEDTGVIDAAVTLMAREGQVKEAMDRLVKHLGTLESALQGILAGVEESEDRLGLQDAAEEVLGALQKYVHVGIWLCQGQTKSTAKTKSVSQRGQRQAANETLSASEALWLSLIDAAVHTTRQLSATIDAVGKAQDDGDRDLESWERLDTDKLLGLLRSLVQHTFTALLTTTSSSSNAQANGRVLTTAGNNMSFLRILREFLAHAAASSPNLADLRAVLASIFSAYAYEELILRLSNRLLERSLFVNVKQSVQLRQRGWRPKGSTCEACGRRVWGPAHSRLPPHEARGKGKIGLGNGAELAQDAAGNKSEDGSHDGDDAAGLAVNSMREQPLGPLVVLACRHIYHQACLDALQSQEEESGKDRTTLEASHSREYRCPVDG
ncbi:hypothetical protein BN1723_008804 [Verticillium longisporum]|uniref:VPS8-like TPR-like repeats domain-containing protein n=1 Tax=Verticillium longisporum TaxID=100787 RepID=A0A0G4KIY1_VERLO|nr:hypothetical protein BN1723_008804 [Verticillium longisporum]